MAENTKTKEKPHTRKLPIVKHTKTSMYRMLKANPLFMLDKDKVQNLGLKGVKLPKTVSQFSDSILPDSDVLGTLKNILNTTKSSTNANGPSHGTKSIGNKSSNKNGNCTRNLKPTTTQDELIVQKSSSAANVYNQSTKTYILKATKTKLNSTSQNKNGALTCMAMRDNFVKRRSSSAETFDDKMVLKSTPPKTQMVQSTENISSFKEENLSPIRDKTKFVTFKTPNLIIHTPCLSKPRISNGYMLTPGRRFNTADLQRRLNDWLTKTGKPIDSCNHLKSFNVQNNSIHEENKENVGKFEDCISGTEEKFGVVTTEVRKDYGILCREALIDLLKLIQDGYPHDQCEAWLRRMREKYTHIDEDAQYWECRAALEESKGNITSAVEFYKNAIVKGAEVQAVEESLDQLLKNFSLLKISAKPAENNEKRRKIVLDARNIFKSSIIKFAIQEKKLKRKVNDDTEAKVATVTPVRRSARLSSAFVQNQRVCKTFKEIGDDTEKIKFENNKFLAARFAPN